MHSDSTDRPSLDERRNSRRIEMESLRARDARGPALKNSVLLTVLCLEYLGLAWSVVEYLPRIESRYVERLGEQPMPEESSGLFDLARPLAGRWLLALAPLAGLAALGALGWRLRRWALFDGLYFGGIVLVALIFVFGYVSLAVPLISAGR